VDKGVAVAVAAVVGGLVVTQAPLNSQLGRVVGSVNASAVALAVSCVALLTLAALTDGLGGIRKIGDAPLHVAIGGDLASTMSASSGRPNAASSTRRTASRSSGRSSRTITRARAAAPRRPGPPGSRAGS
jgi:Putative inner membrane exporter, YdcZ